MLEDSSELDSALKGFQLSCILGFALKESNLSLYDASQAEAHLKSLMAQRDEDVCSSYQERYLDCQGAMCSALKRLSLRISSGFWGGRHPKVAY
jgi:hypothetical protein